ncbi:MAG TPA: hypothetical protein VL463_08935, partial [Kofleriaceae bacterium]|nr:hypothetical protein [Kofleriaceae bacterium]
MAIDALKQALLDFSTELEKTGVRMFLGGGYGLYLKQLSLENSGTRTFLSPDAWPRARATADLDVFLPTEIVVDYSHMVHVREALDALDYKPDESAKFMHFTKTVEGGEVRIELLSGPVEGGLRNKVKITPPRIRPKGRLELHAYLTTEAIALEEQPTVLDVDGVHIFIPNVFTFLLMKLHAFNDRKEEAVSDDEGRQLGRHHALDIYRLIAMASEDEVELARELRKTHSESQPVATASRIVAEDFVDSNAIGALRIREHALAGSFLDIDRFLSL